MAGIDEVLPRWAEKGLSHLNCRSEWLTSEANCFVGDDSLVAPRDEKSLSDEFIL